uniref:Uncharacterized protein n=1 Tax=Oscillatoriales cyanobacterium SpSt-402 TaxID=2282168 RepID=A0A832M4N7_9CYAN
MTELRLSLRKIQVFGVVVLLDFQVSKSRLTFVACSNGFTISIFRIYCDSDTLPKVLENSGDVPKLQIAKAMQKAFT